MTTINVLLCLLINLIHDIQTVSPSVSPNARYINSGIVTVSTQADWTALDYTIEFGPVVQAATRRSVCLTLNSIDVTPSQNWIDF